MVCLKCSYDSSLPSAQQVCNSSNTETCSSSNSYCASLVYTEGNKTSYMKACDPVNACTDPSMYCSNMTSTNNYKTCKMTCCTDNKCNDKFPSSSDSGVDHAKVGQVVFIMGLVATIFFA